MLSYIKNLSSNQQYAIVLLVFSCIYTVLGFQMPEAFFSDPVGSDAWVKGVGFCLIILSLLLLVFPSQYAGNFPRLKEWIMRIPFVVIIIIYANFLPLLGFALSTLVLMVVIAKIFGAKIIQSIFASILMTIGCYVIFDVLLGISLPSGLWFK